MDKKKEGSGKKEDQDIVSVNEREGLVTVHVKIRVEFYRFIKMASEHELRSVANFLLYSGIKAARKAGRKLYRRKESQERDDPVTISAD